MLKKFAEVLEKSHSYTDKVGMALTLNNLAELVEATTLSKTGADQSDLPAAQIDQIRVQSNPVTGILQQFMMKQPPANLPQLVELFSQKLLQDLQSSIQSGPGVSDPLQAENNRLKVIVENLQLKQQMKQIQQQEAQQAMDIATAEAQKRNMPPVPSVAATAPIMNNQGMPVGSPMPEGEQQGMDQQGMEQEPMGGDAMGGDAMGGGGQPDAGYGQGEEQQEPDYLSQF